MPPPPPNSRTSSGVPQAQSLQYRLQRVVQHQQFFWWLCHVIAVLATLVHAVYWFRFSYNTKAAIFFYRLALIGAIGSYGIVVHKMFFKVLPPNDMV